MSAEREALRKLIHIAMVLFALLLRPFAWWQAALMALAALLHNAVLFRALYGDSMLRRDERAQRLPRGIIYYPLSILLATLVFHREMIVVGAMWGVLALGDGFAALIGKRFGVRRLPWNPTKSWIGSAAFVVCGGAGAFGLALYLRERTLTGEPASVAAIAVAAFAAAVAAALAESLATGVDDNLVLTSTAASVFWLSLRADPAVVWSARFAVAAVTGLVVSALAGAVAYRARSVDISGYIAGTLVGAAVWTGGGPAAFLTLVTFFAVAVAATRLGYEDKARRGLAEGRGGRRTARQALANGLVGAATALAAGVVPELRSIMLVAFVAAFATAAADTVSSEVGKRFGAAARLATTLGRVAPGTEGAISLQGTVAGALAAVLVATSAVVGGLMETRLAACAVVAAVIGNQLESVAGALWGAEDEVQNQILNFANTAAGAIIAVGLVWLSSRG